MPDPGDFEPDDEENFDPSKKGNYDKVSRHGKFGKFYRDAKDSRVWYSKDTAGHGGEHWKKFVVQGKNLVHKADIDMAGRVMTKHKGPVGKVLDNLIGIK